MVIKIRKCNCWNEEKKRCNKPIYITLKVQVFHPDSLRKTWQTWYICKDHFFHFKKSMENDNEYEWGCEYRNKKPFAPAIDYKII
jgi:hypothetical protein